MDWVHLYVDDWLAHTAELSPTDTGAYISLFCHFICRDGHVADDDRVLARITKLDPRAWKRTKQRLIQGAYIQIVDGFVRGQRLSKALARGLATAQLQASRSAKGWQTRRVKSLNGQHPPHATAMPRQRPGIIPAKPSITNTTSLSKERGAEAPNGRTTPGLFGACLDYFISSGSTEKDARSLLGGWRKKFGESVVLEAIAEAQRQSVSAPVAWVSKALQARSSARPDDGWL
jgi:uncharacterized protein YdaU (DUF1376 family)